MENKVLGENIIPNLKAKFQDYVTKETYDSTIGDIQTVLESI